MRYTKVIPLLHLGAVALQSAAKDVTEQTKDSIEEKAEYSLGIKHETNLQANKVDNPTGSKAKVAATNIPSQWKDESCSAFDQASKLEVPKAEGDNY